MKSLIAVGLALVCAESASAQFEPPHENSCWELDPATSTGAKALLEFADLTPSCSQGDLPNPQTFPDCHIAAVTGMLAEFAASRSAIDALYGDWDINREAIQAQWNLCVAGGGLNCDDIWNKVLCDDNASYQAAVSDILAEHQTAMGDIELQLEACITANQAARCVAYMRTCGVNLEPRPEAPEHASIPDGSCPDGSAPPAACADLADGWWFTIEFAAWSAHKAARLEAWFEYQNMMSFAVANHDSCLVQGAGAVYCCALFEADAEQARGTLAAVYLGAESAYDQVITDANKTYRMLIVACCR